MSDYAHIREDCQKVGRQLMRIGDGIEKMASEGNGEVRFSAKEAAQLSSFLLGAAGLLYHLGNEADAAHTLVAKFAKSWA